MKLGKHAVKVLAVFAVLFVVGFALKFLNLHEGFYNRGKGKALLKYAAEEYVRPDGKFKGVQWNRNTEDAVPENNNDNNGNNGNNNNNNN